MIKSVQIKNFKSVVDLTLNLGTFNVLIGANGCGKSNILEAIAFSAAASADKLDYEFLGSRGIRMTEPEFMVSAFTNGKKRKSIPIIIRTDRQTISCDLTNDPKSPKKWLNRYKEIALKEINRIQRGLLEEHDEEKRKAIIDELDDEKGHLHNIMNALHPILKINKDARGAFSSAFTARTLETIFSSPEISNYIVYSIEQSSLIKFYESPQMYPLGIKGEGVFQYLKDLLKLKKNTKILQEIKSVLLLLDWFEDFQLPKDLMRNEFALAIKDKFLHKSLNYFDQRSANEGFLFLLFYSTLFISKETPKFFAIDNIDTSLNPKLCIQLVKSLTALAKRHGKQVIVTTHNPAVLDGLNLKDSSQRLFVIRRNDEGHTKATRIEHKSGRQMKLSEIWTKGFIGGLPDNF